MCKEDVRIKRKTAYNTAAFTANNGALALLFKANPMRVALTMACSNTGFTQNQGFAVLKTGPNQDAAVIIGIGQGQNANHVTIEELGAIITGEVWGRGDDSGTPSIMVSEVFFTEELADV